MKIHKRIYFWVSFNLPLVLLFLTSIPRAAAETAVHVIDVDYGSAVHVEDGYNHYLFDVGSKDTDQQVLAHLSSRYVTRINAIFLTHTHKDHAGGVLPLVKQLTTSTVYWNEEYPPDEDVVEELYAAQKIVSFKKLSPGQDLRLGRDLHLKVLESSYEPDNLNDASLVFLLSYRKNKLLIPGDIGLNRQKNVAAVESKNISKVNWMLWPHHGDALDSSFRRSFKKLKTCVISVGENKYGLPVSDIQTLSSDLCESVYSTDRQGTLSFTVKKKKIINTLDNAAK